MVYDLRLGRSRIFAASAAYSCCACFIADEPGGGSISRCGVAGGCAAGGCVEVHSGGGQGRACRRRAAVGVSSGCAAQSDSQMGCGGGRFLSNRLSPQQINEFIDT